MNDNLVQGIAVFAVLLLLIVAFTAAGADIMIQLACQDLGYDTGGVHFLQGMQAYCVYEPLEVPFDELLKPAFETPTLEGTST